MKLSKLKHLLPVLAGFAMVSCGMMKGQPEAFTGKMTYGISIEMADGSENPMLDQMKGMLPNEMAVASDGENYAMKMDGMQGMHLVAKPSEDMVYIATQGQYIKQKLSEMNQPEEGEEPASEDDISIEETGDTKEILGFTAKGYKVTDADGNVTTMYVTEDLVMNVPEAMGGLGGPSGFSKQVKGTPLRIEQSLGQAGMDMLIIFEAAAIEEGAEAATPILTPEEGDYQMEE
ncbi:MAG: hypothetical protein HWE14_00790 [Flavobacteriia bacterium]|nr:hypothetical protein [Flavobacteriia bacterium]